MNTIFLACATCFGASDSLMAKGMNAGILFLMGIVTAVLCSILAFMIYLIKKSKVSHD